MTKRAPDLRVVPASDDSALLPSGPEELRIARFALDRAGEAVFWVDSSGRIDYANDAAARMFQYTVDELQTKTIADLDPEVEPEAWPRIWAKIKRRQSYSFEAKMETKSGQMLSVDVSVYFLVHDGREMTCCFLRDVTERRQIEAILRAAKEEADRVNVAKSWFLAAASHDLRQPLHAMDLLTTALSPHVQGEEGQRIVSDIRDSLALSRRLLNALLDVSELEAGVVRPKTEDFCVGMLLRRIHQQYGVIAREKGLDLRCVPSSAVVHSDPGMLERILDNFVANAVRYTDRGRVLFGCRRAGPIVRLEVWDTGPGIPTDQYEAIFDDFCQLDSAARSRGAGLGLGLGLVRRLASLLGHRVGVKSEVGKGSVFWIELKSRPGCRPQPHQAPVHAAEAVRPGTSVMVIEDDAMILNAMTHVLEGWGYSVEALTSASAAAESTTIPDIIIADYRLPNGETGVQAVEAVRKRAGSPQPAIIVTGDLAPKISRELEESELHVLKKPVRPAKLRAVIRHLTGGAGETDASDG